MSFDEWFVTNGVCLGVGLGLSGFVTYLLALSLSLRASRILLAQVPALREREGERPTLRYFLAYLTLGVAMAAMITAFAIATFAGLLQVVLESQ